MLQIDATSYINIRRKKHILDIAHYFPVQNFTKYHNPSGVFGKDIVLYSRDFITPQWRHLWKDIKSIFDLSWMFSPELNWQRGAIAVDATSVGQTASTDPLNITHVITGTNTVLYCMFGDSNAGPSSPTYAGTGMTQIIRSIVTREAVIFRLIAPATGSNTLAITGGTNSDVVSGNVSFTGADQSQTSIASTTGTGTLSLTTVFDDAFIVQVTAHNAAETADSGQTVIQNATQGIITSISAYKSFPGAAGSKAMNISAAQDNALVEVKAGAAVTAANFLLMGVG